MNQCGKGAGKEIFFQYITVSYRQASACNLSWSIRIYLSVPQLAEGDAANFQKLLSTFFGTQRKVEKGSKETTPAKRCHFLTVKLMKYTHLEITQELRLRRQYLCTTLLKTCH